MVLASKNTQPLQQTIDLRISIPELPNIDTFWIRDYPTHQNFAELYQHCVNRTVLASERKTLEKVRASRHFWFNDVMLRRDVLVNTLLASDAPQAGTRQEITLVLRRDYYQVHPANLLKTKSEHIYIDAEKPINEIVKDILISDECPSCFDLCTRRKKRISHNHSLAEEKLWPAWEDAPANEFPMRAYLLLRPRVSWLPYALYAAALTIGLLIGYRWIAAALVPLPS